MEGNLLFFDYTELKVINVPAPNSDPVYGLANYLVWATEHIGGKWFVKTPKNALLFPKNVARHLMQFDADKPILLCEQMFDGSCRVESGCTQLFFIP